MSEFNGRAETREQRFTSFFAECYGPVLAYARRRVNDDAAQDVVAETFLAAWRHFDELSGEPLPWLYRVTSHAIANHRRGVARQDRLQERERTRLPASNSVVPDHADSVAGTGQFMTAFRSLKERDREVLRLVGWEGLATPEAASAMHCSPVAFKVRLHRARHRLSRLIEAENEGQDLETRRPTATARKETP